jgi:hypothetical protein
MTNRRKENRMYGFAVFGARDRDTALLDGRGTENADPL